MAGSIDPAVVIRGVQSQWQAVAGLIDPSVVIGRIDQSQWQAVAGSIDPAVVIRYNPFSLEA